MPKTHRFYARRAATVAALAYIGLWVSMVGARTYVFALSRQILVNMALGLCLLVAGMVLAIWSAGRMVTWINRWTGGRLQFWAGVIMHYAGAPVRWFLGGGTTAKF